MEPPPMPVFSSRLMPALDDDRVEQAVLATSPDMDLLWEACGSSYGCGWNEFSKRDKIPHAYLDSTCILETELTLSAGMKNQRHSARVRDRFRLEDVKAVYPRPYDGNS